MSYTRVIPRDLFNEAKLLKCLGQLALLIHDRTGLAAKLTLEHNDEERADFQIEQDESNGALRCDNLTLWCCGRHVIGLSSPYNSKDPFPLRFAFINDEEGRVFDDAGQLSPEFSNLLARLT